MRRTGHRRAETLHDYVRPATVSVDNSAGCLDLDTSEGSWLLNAVEVAVRPLKASVTGRG